MLSSPRRRAPPRDLGEDLPIARGLPTARLTFQVLCICRAIVDRHDEPAWGFVVRLNEVRNRMAHRLDPGDVNALVGSTLEKLGPQYSRRNETPINKLRQAAFHAWRYFDAIKGTADYARGGC